MFLNYSQVLWLTSENVLMKPSQLWRGGCEPSHTVYWSQQQEQDTIEMLHQLILPQGRVQSRLGGGGVVWAPTERNADFLVIQQQ